MIYPLLGSFVNPLHLGGRQGDTGSCVIDEPHAGIEPVDLPPERLRERICEGVPRREVDINVRRDRVVR
jgi:hypothetical protein